MNVKLSRALSTFLVLALLLAATPPTPLLQANSTRQLDQAHQSAPNTAISRVSVSSTGVQGDFGSYAPSVSSDGRYVAFDSYATNLVSGDTNDYPDVFVHDRQTGQTMRVSLSSSGAQANGYSFIPSISGDGRYVAFDSYATNLASPCTNGHDQIFVRDRQNSTTTCVSVSSAGQQGNGESSPAIISADGRYVAFASASTNLVSGDTNGAYDIFVRDRQNNATERVSVSSSEAEGNSGAEQFGFSISADGRYVAFASGSANLVSGDTNGAYDIFVRDRQAGTTSRVSVSSSGVQGNGAALFAAISGDGRFIAFNSCADNLVSGDTNNECDVFVRDQQSGTTQRITMSYDGVEANGSASDLLSISADGRFVSFISSATNLVPGDNNGAADAFVHDRQGGETWRLSVDSNGQEATGPSYPPLSSKPAISGDGSVIAFQSYAANLVSGDTNSESDVFARARGTAPTYPYLTAAPASLPADGATTTTITLLRATSGHTVRLLTNRSGVDTFASSIGVVNGSGQYATTLRSATAGTAIITVQDLSSGATLPASVQVTFTSTGGGGTLPPQTGPLAITAVRPTYPLDGRYLQGLSVPNRIAVTVDWRGSTPDRVDFVLNGVIYSEPASSSGTSHTFDMGSALRNWQNSLRITAYNAEGQTSQPVDYAPYSVPAPAWLTSLQAVGAIAPMAMGGSWSGGYEYEANVKIPPDGINLGAPGFGPPGSSTKLGFFVGGGFKLPLTCDSPVAIRAQAGAEAEIDLLSVEFGGELKGSGELEAHAVQCEVPTVSGNVRVDIKVYGQKNWPVLVFVVDFIAPGAGETLESILPHDVLTILGQVYLQGNLQGYFSSEARVISASPYLEWENVHVGGGPGLEAGYQFEKLGVKLKLYLGASGSLDLASSTPLRDLSDLDFDHVAVTGEAGYQAQVFWWEQSERFVVEWRYPPGMLQSLPLSDHAPSGWHLIGHNTAPDYATFRAAPGKRQAFASSAADVQSADLAAQTTVTSVLVSNVYTYPEPSLAVNPTTGHALMLWVHDDIAKPVGQSHEIEFSRWNGLAWSAPAGVTNDNQLDGAPQVAWTGDGRAVAVWQRLNDTLPITATWDVTTANKIEIATSVYSPTVNTWSPVTLLTNNSALDVSPRLARNASGQLLAAWRQNSAGLLGGTVTDTDRIQYAFYDNGWGTPATAVNSIPGLVDLAVGYGNNAATIAYTRYLTPTGYPTPTLQLFTSIWNGSAWSAPQQRTDDSLGHRSPQVAYNTLNQPILFWLAGNELRLRNLATGATASLTLEDSSTIDEFRVVWDAASRLAAVFTAQTEQRDLFVAFYDSAYGMWGRPVPLSHDRTSEAYPAAALDTAGRLLMGYAATAIVPVTRTTTISGTGQVVTYTLPTEGQTDLLTLSHEFTRNLTLDDLAISTDHPTPGANVVLSATIRNSGDLAVGGVTVGFYDGDPLGGGTLIGNVTLPNPLAGGFTATLTTTYSVPVTGGAHILYAVADPAHLIAESDEADNTAVLAAFGPDLEIASAGADYWGSNNVGLVTLVRNIGTSDAPTTTLAFYRGALTGTLAATDTVPMLAAGQTITRTTPWNFGPLSAGDYPLVAIVNQGQFSETWTANNVFTFTLDVRPDLMVSPYYLWISSPSGTTVLVTTTVYNLGVITATDVMVGFYGDDRLDGGAALFTRTIPVLGPGGSTTLSGQVNGPLACTLYAYIDPGRTITETTRVNNLAGISYRGLCQRVYLPLVLR